MTLESPGKLNDRGLRRVVMIPSCHITGLTGVEGIEEDRTVSVASETAKRLWYMSDLRVLPAFFQQEIDHVIEVNEGMRNEVLPQRVVHERDTWFTSS